MTTQQSDFFKESDKSLGVFYPLHYIIAGYDTIDEARDAGSAFCEAGKPVEDVRVATGEFVAKQLESREDAGWFEQAEARLVDFVGTEASYIQEDMDHAHDGGAFVFVYAPDDESVSAARQIFEHHAPAYARRYLRVAIERIVENSNAP